MKRPALAVVFLVAVVACGQRPAVTSGPPTADALRGRLFNSTSVLEDGEPIALFDDETVFFWFADDLGFAAGGDCNGISSSFAVEAGRLRLTDRVVANLRGCDPPAQQRDDWVTQFVAARPALLLDGDMLTATADGRVVEFLEGTMPTPTLTGGATASP